MSSYVVALSTYFKTLDGDSNKQIRDYSSHLGDNFYVLFDNQTNLETTIIAEKYSSKICSYSLEDFERYSFNKPIDFRHRWGNHQNPKYFYAHFRMLVFYINNPNHQYYWFLDDDVSFEGDLKGFFDFYESLDDDFVAIQAFKKEDYPEFPRISVINSRMEGSRGNWLGLCPGPGDNFKSLEFHIGSFFPIVRFSNESMRYLLKIHEEGYYGYSEGFVPTNLASAGFNVSSILNEFNKPFIQDNTNCTLYHKGIKFTWEWL